MPPWWMLLIWGVLLAGFFAWCWAILKIQRAVVADVRWINAMLAERPDLWPWFRSRLAQLGLLR